MSTAVPAAMGISPSQFRTASRIVDSQNRLERPRRVDGQRRALIRQRTLDA
jgi:hypothetical protein